MDGLDQRVNFQVPSHPPRRMKILAHAFAQVARLADVNDRAEPVLHQVDARLCGRTPSFFADASVAGTKEFQRKAAGAQRDFYGKILSCATNQIGVISGENPTKEIYVRKSNASGPGHLHPPNPHHSRAPTTARPACGTCCATWGAGSMHSVRLHAADLADQEERIPIRKCPRQNGAEFSNYDAHCVDRRLIASVCCRSSTSASSYPCLFPLIGLAYLILVIIAGIKANNGEITSIRSASNSSSRSRNGANGHCAKNSAVPSLFGVPPSGGTMRLDSEPAKG